MVREPSLLTKPGPLVLPGDSVTLECHSEPSFNRFALTKDEGLTPLQHLHGQHRPSFPLGPVSLAHGGWYRCCSGHNLSYGWSAPSAALDIVIAGEEPCPSPCPDCLLRTLAQGHHGDDWVQVRVLEEA